jgi:hypothetical protein
MKLANARQETENFMFVESGGQGSLSRAEGGKLLASVSLWLYKE